MMSALAERRTGWSELCVERRGARSVVSAARSVSPLRLLAPAGGRAAWVYQSSLGGGFVGADDVALRVEVARDAALFLSSQASSKVYRGARAAFTLDAAVGEGATLVAWPDPVVCFAGAAFEQVQRFALARTGSLVAVDAWTAGRVARGERWAFERLATRLSVSCAGEPVLDEAMLLSSAHGPLAARLGGRDAFATIVLAGPRFQRACDELVAALAARPPGDPLIVASRWPWGAVVRIAAAAAEPLARATRDLLQACVAEAIGGDPWARKW